MNVALALAGIWLTAAYFGRRAAWAVMLVDFQMLAEKYGPAKPTDGELSQTIYWAMGSGSSVAGFVAMVLTALYFSSLPARATRRCTSLGRVLRRLAARGPRIYVRLRT
ncbi:MAG: hypothetical protein HY471_01490 [Candidatus Sungbacteria bacterium]|nr:hypothetical protein [Candidatus Sungbacteria bacterium]